MNSKRKRVLTAADIVCDALREAKASTQGYRIAGESVTNAVGEEFGRLIAERDKLQQQLTPVPEPTADRGAAPAGPEREAPHLTGDILRAVDDYGAAMAAHRPIASALRHTLHVVIDQAVAAAGGRPTGTAPLPSDDVPPTDAEISEWWQLYVRDDANPVDVRYALRRARREVLRLRATGERPAEAPSEAAAVRVVREYLVSEGFPNLALTMPEHLVEIVLRVALGSEPPEQEAK